MTRKSLVFALCTLHFSFFTVASAAEIRINKTTKPPKMEYKENFVRDSAKEVVVDKNRALMWQDSSGAKTVQRDWKDAKSYCRNLSHAGYSDWRLPTIRELESIAEPENYPNAIASTFQNSYAGYYWSSSESLLNSDYAWYVYFKYGYSDYYSKSSKFHVRCVREN